jgi:hypothetical protein
MTVAPGQRNFAHHILVGGQGIVPTLLAGDGGYAGPGLLPRYVRSAGARPGNHSQAASSRLDDGAVPPAVVAPAEVERRVVGDRDFCCHLLVQIDARPRAVVGPVVTVPQLRAALGPRRPPGMPGPSQGGAAGSRWTGRPRRRPQRGSGWRVGRDGQLGPQPGGVPAAGPLEDVAGSVAALQPSAVHDFAVGRSAWAPRQEDLTHATEITASLQPEPPYVCPILSSIHIPKCETCGVALTARSVVTIPGHDSR